MNLRFPWDRILQSKINIIVMGKSVYDQSIGQPTQSAIAPASCHPSFRIIFLHAVQSQILFAVGIFAYALLPIKQSYFVLGSTGNDTISLAELDVCYPKKQLSTPVV
jgi:hypothetical protein